MPRRKRSSKRIGAALTLSRYVALQAGPRPLTGEDDRTLALVWAHHRERLTEDGPPPWGFWYFDESVPEELREERPALEPVDDGQDQADEEHVRAEREALEARRAAWLLERDIADLEHIGA